MVPTIALEWYPQPSLGVLWRHICIVLLHSKTASKFDRGPFCGHSSAQLVPETKHAHDDGRERKSWISATVANHSGGMRFLYSFLTILTVIYWYIQSERSLAIFESPQDGYFSKTKLILFGAEILKTARKQIEDCNLIFRWTQSHHTALSSNHERRKSAPRFYSEFPLLLLWCSWWMRYTLFSVRILLFRPRLNVLNFCRF